MKRCVLLYGATGYTGRLTAALAAGDPLPLVLAGRDASAVPRLADAMGRPGRTFDLGDPDAIDAALNDCFAVLHLAGPFGVTAAPMVAACLRTGTHYVDVTGEIDVIQATAARDAEARERGVLLISAAGFISAPGDCLAAHTAARVADPDLLEVAGSRHGPAGSSRGTLATLTSRFDRPVLVRKDGQLVSSRVLRRRFDIGDGPRSFTAVALADLATGYFSTGIPNIIACFPAGLGARLGLRLAKPVGWLARSAPARRLIASRLARRPAGPSAAQREASSATLFARVSNAAGESAVSLLTTPEAYTTTALGLLAMARRLMAGPVSPGFNTVSRAFGADFILELPGVSRIDR